MAGFISAWRIVLYSDVVAAFAESLIAWDEKKKKKTLNEIEKDLGVMERAVRLHQFTIYWRLKEHLTVRYLSSSMTPTTNAVRTWSSFIKLLRLFITNRIGRREPTTIFYVPIE